MNAALTPDARWMYRRALGTHAEEVSRYLSAAVQNFADHEDVDDPLLSILGIDGRKGAELRFTRKPEVATLRLDLRAMTAIINAKTFGQRDVEDTFARWSDRSNPKDLSLLHPDLRRQFIIDLQAMQAAARAEGLDHLADGKNARILLGNWLPSDSERSKARPLNEELQALERLQAVADKASVPAPPLEAAGSKRTQRPFSRRALLTAGGVAVSTSIAALALGRGHGRSDAPTAPQASLTPTASPSVSVSLAPGELPTQLDTREGSTVLSTVHVKDLPVTQGGFVFRTVMQLESDAYGVPTLHMGLLAGFDEYEGDVPDVFIEDFSTVKDNYTHGRFGPAGWSPLGPHVLVKHAFAEAMTGEQVWSYELGTSKEANWFSDRGMFTAPIPLSTPSTPSLSP